MADSIEMYLGDEQRPFLFLDSSFAPEKGDLINLEKKTYIVLGRSFTVDYASLPRQKRIRCNVIVKEKI